MKRMMMISLLSVSVAGCGSALDRFGLGARSEAAPGAPADPFVSSEAPVETATLGPATAAPPPPPAAQTADAFDTTTAEQRAAAVAPAAGGVRDLGTTVASLGDPTQAGLWMKTPLVQAEAQGRVTNTKTGKSSLVTLLPLEGAATAGSQMSLSALRLIGASLTDLTEVTVALGG